MRKDWLLICVIAAFVLQAPVFGEAVIEIRAVKINDAPIPGFPDGTTTPSVLPGDTVEAEIILLPGWGADLPTGIRVLQVVIDGRFGVTSGGNDRVIPVGWIAPLDLVACQVSGDCPFGFFCDTALGKCVGSLHTPEAGAFIDASAERTDFILHREVGQDVQCFVGTTTLTYNFACLNRDNTGGNAIDDGMSELYMGTYILKVGDHACGTFTFTGITIGSDRSELIAPDLVTVATPRFVPLEIDTGVCGLLPTDPLNCSLDARYPHSPLSTSQLFAEKTFDLEFAGSASGLRKSHFSASTFPLSFPAPGIDTVVVDGSSATVTMIDQFVDERWTCIRHIATNRSFCHANLPGDSDQGQLVETADVLALVLNLDPPILGDSGEPYVPLSLPACDIDRSGICRPLDILASVNLLIGSGQFSPPYLGEELDFRCPGAPLP